MNYHVTFYVDVFLRFDYNDAFVISDYMFILIGNYYEKSLFCGRITIFANFKNHLLRNRMNLTSLLNISKICKELMHRFLVM